MTLTNEGETCMHGNAWHSECSDCNEMNLLDDIFELIKKCHSDATDPPECSDEYFNSFIPAAVDRLLEYYNKETTTTFLDLKF